MMEGEELVLRHHMASGITTISLNRPEKRNALNIALLEAICKAIEQTQTLEKQRVLIIRGEGPIFCAGLDLTEASDDAFSHQSADLVARLLSLLHTTPLVTIAAVHGAALAGGCGLAAACDFVVAAQGTRFGFPEIRRGLVAAQVMTFLQRQLKQRDLRELLLLGELIEAQKALDIGLINRIVDAEDLMTEALAVAHKVLLGAPQALAMTKKLMDDLYPSRFNSDLKKALEVHRVARLSDEAKEGMRAFLDKRDPIW